MEWISDFKERHYGAQASSLHYGPQASCLQFTKQLLPFWPQAGQRAAVLNAAGTAALLSYENMKHSLYLALAGLYLLHNDLFLWHDECLIGGFPSGLLYHVAYCIAASLLMFLLIRFAWPDDLETEPHHTK